MSAMTLQEKRRLQRLGPALEARKRADMARFAEIRARRDQLDAEISALNAEVQTASEALDMTDLTGYARFETWRDAARAALARLTREYLLAEAALEAQRRSLLRSNGEVEALKRLLEGGGSGAAPGQR